MSATIEAKTLQTVDMPDSLEPFVKDDLACKDLNVRSRHSCSSAGQLRIDRSFPRQRSIAWLNAC